jgi:PIN domain nuclease of toxin-antitoxin system
MAWLVKHGRIDLNMTFDDWLRQIEDVNIIEFLPVTARISANAINLPEHHKDPMDRIIISTALHYDAQLISFDHIFPAYQDTGLQLISKIGNGAN